MPGLVRADEPRSLRWHERPRQECAVLAERARLAREIHDTVAQSLAAIAVQAYRLEESLHDDPEQARRLLRQIRQLAREGLDESRRAVEGLRPDATAHGDMVAAVRRAITNATLGTSLQGSLAVIGEPRSLGGELEAHILRLIREAVANAVKHSEAAQVTVTLRYTGRAFEACIADNGSGFTPGAAGGFGLTSMRERAAAIGGRLRLTSVLGKGTTVTLRIEREVLQ